jgi:hypothetical protein
MMSDADGAVLDNVRSWAERHLTMNQIGAGLDIRQLMQQWTWWRFTNGESTEETQVARIALPGILQNLGARKRIAHWGGAKYEWWTVAPADWIAGRRDLPTELLSKLDASHFNTGPWTWENKQSLGEAAGELLWKFRRLDVVGVLAEDIGYLDNDFARRHVPNFPEHVDVWQWEPLDKRKPLGAGRVGVALYELRDKFLEQISQTH